MNLGEMLNYIDAVLPNTVSTEIKVKFINDEQKKIFKYMNEVDMYEVITIAGQPIYSIPSDCEVELIDQVLVASSTEAVTADTQFNAYKYAGQNDSLDGGNFYFDALGKLGLYPIPDKTNYALRIIYEKRPIIFATADTATEFNIEGDFLDFIQNKVMSKIAKTGNYPDIELANNYEIEASSIESKLKMDRAKKRTKNPKSRYSYKEGWDN